VRYHIKRPRPQERARKQSAPPAIGLEAEFTTVVDGLPAKPEDVFRSPRDFIRGPLIHRTGRSYQLPTGGAIYFDTGVLEIATPMIEIARGCGARGTRSLWESLGYVREELDAWEQRTGRTIRLVGFSAHYNVSFDGNVDDEKRSVQKLAYLLTHIVAAPVMMLAANRMSTGIGVRPRGNRVEITADFTPDAALMAATTTLIVGIVRDVATWSSYELGQLQEQDIPVVRGFTPEKHSSRKGWVARHSSYPRNPFTSDVNERSWETTTGEVLSLRDIAGRITRRFSKSIRSIGDAASLNLIAGIMRGRATSMLELDERPTAYEVGRLCRWDDLFPVSRISRSRMERVVGHALSGNRLRIGGQWHRPVGMRGWTHVVFRSLKSGARKVLSMEELLAHLGTWDRSANRRFGERRRQPAMVHAGDRRVVDRRVPIKVYSESRRKGDARKGVGIPEPSDPGLEAKVDPL
jgi:hypothetical protein